MNWSDPMVVANIALVVVTVVLVILTWKYTRATGNMADVMYKDYAARNTPLLDVTHELGPTPQGQGFTYQGTITLINKGAVGIRVEEVLVCVGDTVLTRQGELILAIGESRPLEIKFTDHDFGWERLQRGEAEFLAEVRYIGFEGGTLTKRFLLPRP